MVKSLSLIVFASWLSLGSAWQTNSSVYICDSKDAKKYHLVKNCRGLSNCQHKIISVTKAAATQRGLTICGWED